VTQFEITAASAFGWCGRSIYSRRSAAASESSGPGVKGELRCRSFPVQNIHQPLKLRREGWQSAKTGSNKITS
jgi:hypothetical protein